MFLERELPLLPNNVSIFHQDAPAVIRSLYQDGHKISLISHRKQSLLNKLEIQGNMENLTMDWLKSAVAFAKYCNDIFLERIRG